MGRVTKSLNCNDCISKGKSLFCDLGPSSLNEVNRVKNTNTYKKGSIIFFDGNPSYGLYCINSGRVKITKNGQDGKEVIVRIGNNGDVIGHRSIFSNENYTATAKTIEDTTMCFFEKAFIFDLIKKEPSVSFRLIQRLSTAMGAAETMSASIVQKNVRGRLAEALLMLGRTYGVEVDGRVKLDISLTREEIAAIVGTANETVIRLISEFREDQIIVQIGKSLFINDEKKLIEYASMG